MKPLKLFILVIALTITACGQVKKDQPASPLPVSPTPVPAPSKNGPNSLSIKYIANEGVLVTAGGKQVLIDAIHREYKPAYSAPPPDLLKALETAAPAYKAIDLILVTHNHLDHFHPESITLHMQNNPRATLVSPGQIVAEIAKNAAGFDAIKPRIKEVTPAWNQKAVMDIGGIKLTVLGLRHVNLRHREVQNLGYIVEIGGRKVLHVGDAELSDENFASFLLNAENIDVAILPAWFLDTSTGCEQVKKLIGAKHLIATHIPPDHAADYGSAVRKHCPGSDAFITLLEERNF
jgi:L-ascorbate metabolism protein UlaG (beta-lactamase superfamily)